MFCETISGADSVGVRGAVLASSSADAKTEVKASTRATAKTAKYFSLKLNRNTDTDIIEYLNSQENIQGYLKRLIREDMKKTGD